MMGQSQQRQECSDDFDMQLIGNFLSFASRGDRVGLNQMLREGVSPNVQDYDRRTALHLAASEGHAPIVELLLHYKADLNLKDRWDHTVSINILCGLFVAINQASLLVCWVIFFPFLCEAPD